DEHTLSVQLGAFQRNHGLAVVPVEMAALPLIVQQPVAVAKFDLTCHSKHRRAHPGRKITLGRTVRGTGISFPDLARGEPPAHKSCGQAGWRPESLSDAPRTCCTIHNAGRRPDRCRRTSSAAAGYGLDAERRPCAAGRRVESPGVIRPSPD